MAGYRLVCVTTMIMKCIAIILKSVKHKYEIIGFLALNSACCGVSRMKKFVEIWLQLHQFVHYETVYFLFYYTLYPHIISLTVYEYQICQYHQKEQLLEDKSDNN